MCVKGVENGHWDLSVQTYPASSPVILSTTKTEQWYTELKCREFD